MRKLLKGFLVAAGILLALAAVGVLAINLYVQSAGTQKRIEHALSKALKAPVQITSTIVTPWSGLKASGITIPQLPPMTGTFLEAADFTAHFEWLPLLKHRLEARQVSLDDPQVEWFQSPGGRWELPRIEEEEHPQPAPSPAATPPPSPIPAPAATPRIPPTPPAPAWQVHVGSLMVNRALFDFWDEKGNRVIEFAGVQFHCDEPRATGASGHASCGTISLHDKLFFRQVETDWSFQRGDLKLTSFHSQAGGGQIRGAAHIATGVKHSPFSVDVNFDGVNVDRLMTEAGQPAGSVTGLLKGWLDLYGNPGKASSINGSGHLELAGGQMRHMEMFETLGTELQIPDLVELKLKTAQVDARVVSGVVNIDRLVLQSQNLELDAHGAIGIDGRLALNARLTLGGSITRKLPAFILTYFKPGDAADARAIDFKIGNTLSHPRQDLIENILGRRMQGEMTDLFRTIFGKKHKEAEPSGPPP